MKYLFLKHNVAREQLRVSHPTGLRTKGMMSIIWVIVLIFFFLVISLDISNNGLTQKRDQLVDFLLLFIFISLDFSFNVTQRDLFRQHQ